jgi:zinc transport system substrate-binding protein
VEVSAGLPVLSHPDTVARVRVRIVLVTGLLVIGGVGAGCGGSGSDESHGRRDVVAAFYPLAFAAEQIGGKSVDVANLTPAGAEPHDLEVSPQDVGRVRSADLVLLLGRGFQPQLEDAAGNGKGVLRLLDTPGLRLRPNDDPHVWLDPLRYALVVERIGRALGNTQAADTLVVRLHRLDREYRRGLASCTHREIVTSHEAFGYLAERYHLRQVAITGLNPEAEPTPRDLAQVIRVVRQSRATTVFAETLLPRRLADTVARETGAHTALLNPIEGLTSQEEGRGLDYFALMGANLAALRRGLGCR